MLVAEIMNTAPKYEVVRETATVFMTQAEIGGRNVKFMGEEEGDGIWGISFVEKTEKGNHTIDATGSGAEFKVFAFVKASIGEMIERYQPAAITFTAAKSEPARSKIYRRLLAKFSQYQEVESGGNADSDYFEYRLK